MASDGSDGKKAAADSPVGEFGIPSWLQAIRGHAGSVNSPAEGEWLFLLNPFGQFPARWFWRFLLAFSWASLGICFGAALLGGLLGGLLGSSATPSAATHISPAYNTRPYFGIAFAVGLAEMLVCALVARLNNAGDGRKSKWLRRMFDRLYWLGLIICLFGLPLVIFSNSAILNEAMLSLPGLNEQHPYLAIAVSAIILLIVIMVCAFITVLPRIRRQTIRYGDKTGQRFFLHVNFEGGGCKMTWATSFTSNPIRPKPKEETPPSYEHPSTIQNTLPRLDRLQEVGRIKLRADKSNGVYIFEPFRWDHVDFLVVALGIALVVAASVLSVYVLAWMHEHLAGDGAPVWIGYAALLFALLLGAVGAVVALYVMWKRWIAGNEGVAVEFGQSQTATLVWNHYLSIRKGFHADSMLLDDVNALRALCESLAKMQEGGKLFLFRLLPPLRYGRA